ncbi:unnamed protein product, partial [Linum tenue]
MLLDLFIHRKISESMNAVCSLHHPSNQFIESLPRVSELLLTKNHRGIFFCWKGKLASLMGTKTVLRKLT